MGLMVGQWRVAGFSWDPTLLLAERRGRRLLGVDVVVDGLECQHSVERQHLCPEGLGSLL